MHARLRILCVACGLAASHAASNIVMPMSLNCVVYESDLVAHVIVEELKVFERERDHPYFKTETVADAKLVAKAAPFKGIWPGPLDSPINLTFGYSGEDEDPFIAQMQTGKEYVVFLRKNGENYEYSLAPHGSRPVSYFGNLDLIREAIDSDRSLQDAIGTLKLTLQIEPTTFRAGESPTFTLTARNIGKQEVLLPCQFLNSGNIAFIGTTRLYVEAREHADVVLALPYSYIVRRDVTPLEIPAGEQRVWKGRWEVKRREVQAPKIRYTWYVRDVASNSVEVTILPAADDKADDEAL